MKKQMIAAIAIASLAFASCSNKNNGGKRIVIMATGIITVADKTIQLEQTLRHTEQDIVFKDPKVTLTVKTSGGTNKSFDLTDDGVYVLNLQSDTLIGGLVNYGAAGRPGSITAAQLDRIIDSTREMMAGSNTSDQKGTYWIPPYTLKKVSTKLNTKVVGSYKGIPYSNEADDSGTIPDVVKFFTNKQKRETLKDLLDEKTKLH